MLRTKIMTGKRNLFIGVLTLSLAVFLVGCGGGATSPGGQSGGESNGVPPGANQNGGGAVTPEGQPGGELPVPDPDVGDTAAPATVIEDLLAGFDQIGAEEIGQVDEELRSEIESLDGEISSALKDVSTTGGAPADSASSGSISTTIDDVLAGFDQIGDQELAQVNEDLQSGIESLDKDISGALEDAANAGN